MCSLQILPSKIDPLVSLMKVEKVPDSTYDMVGGLDKQVKEIKEMVLYSVSEDFFAARQHLGTTIG